MSPDAQQPLPATPGEVPLVEASDLELWRGERCLATGLSLAVHVGEILLLRGANGTGKTTLLRTLAGLRPVAEGSVSTQLAPADPRAAGPDAGQGAAEEAAYIGYLGHRPPIKAALTVEEHLRFALSLTRRTVAETPAALAARVGLAQQMERLGRELSAGQGRRLGLALLLAKGTRLWLLDEPYTGLDAQGEALLDGLLQEHLTQGGAAILAVHRLPELDGVRTRELTL